MRISILAVLIGSVIINPFNYTPAEAKKLKDWCYGNGCISGGGMAERSGWHECGKTELNVCRKQAAEKPQ